MPSLAFTGDAKFAFAVSVGLALVVLARWASRTRGTKRDTWVALRIGDVLFTEIIGAFLLGYGLGGLIAPPEVAGPGGPPVRIGPAGRFGGGLGSSLPYTLAIVGAALAILTRLDLGTLFVRGSAPRGGLSTYVGWTGRSSPRSRPADTVRSRCATPWGTRSQRGRRRRPISRKELLCASWAQRVSSSSSLPYRLPARATRTPCSRQAASVRPGRSAPPRSVCSPTEMVGTCSPR